MPAASYALRTLLVVSDAFQPGRGVQPGRAGTPPLNCPPVSVHSAEAHIEDQPATARPGPVVRLCVLLPGPGRQAAPRRDLGHLQVTRAPRGCFQLAGRLTGLVPGGERLPGARIALRVQLPSDHADGSRAARAKALTGTSGTGRS